MGMVVQCQDGGEFLSPARPHGDCRIKIENRGEQTSAVTIKLHLQIPQGGHAPPRSVPLPFDLDVVLPPGMARIATFPLTLSPESFRILAELNPSFAASTLEFRVEAESHGKAIEAIVPDGHLPCALRPAKDFPDAAVDTSSGGGGITIQGQRHAGAFAYVGWNWGAAHESIRDFSKSGIHAYRVVFQPWSLWRDGRLDAEAFERKTNEIIASIVGRDPQAVIYFFWWLHVPKNWGDRNPDDVILYDDGTPATPHPSADQRGWRHASLSSARWRSQQSELLTTAIQKLRRSPYADRIFSISVGYGNGGEWNGFGYHGGKFSDYSPVARQAFQDWCRKTYRTLPRLNRAWGTTLGSWSEIAAPTRARRLLPGWGSFAGPGMEDVADYHRFQSQQTADQINHFARVIKEASDGRLLTGAFYGYFASHLTAAPYHSLDSGHYDLERVLKSPDIDFIMSPYAYGDRQRNIGLGMPVASVLAAEKAFIVEADLATHLDGVNAAAAMSHHGGICDSPERSLLFYWRDVARINTWGVNAHWYDFNKGWFRFPEFQTFLQEVGEVQRQTAKRNARGIAKVAVILDEKSAFHSGSQSGPYGDCLYDTLAYELDGAGAPWDAWLASDLEKVLSSGYEMIIFLNQLQGSEAIASRLAKHPANVLWVYGAGLIQDEKWTQKPLVGGVSMEVLLEECVGEITLDDLRIPAPTSHRKWAGQTVEPVEPIKPRIVISGNASLNVLARFREGQIAIAELPREKGREFFVMTPLLSSEILGYIYDLSKIHRYTRDGSKAYVNSALAALWNADGGDSTIRFPKSMSKIVDARTGRLVAEDTDSIEVKGSPGQPTFGFFYYENQ